jgi:hypothetical protein
MPYYHIQIKYREPDQSYINTDYELDLSEADAKTFGEQYVEGLVLFKRARHAVQKTLARPQKTANLKSAHNRR